MTSVAAFAELCPGCFADKGTASICPHCGYDESLKRGPLVLAHRTLLNHGQYLIGRVLGKPGGFGITYLALDTKLETRVAIKEYLPRDLAGRDAGHATISAHSAEDGEFFSYGLTQFLQEARTLAQFDHANIVRVRNFFEENGTGYLVMDYYDGVTLADYLAQQPQGRLPEKTAVGILMPILDGLREVHAKNFLHRDIKPQNIYLTTGNRPILLDFGAARQAMSERSRSLSVVLSEGYAPYEQYHRRGEQGPWTDIYACAAVLYHAVAGEAPPPATERVHEDELDIAALGVSGSLAEALRLGLAVDHNNRPQRMTEFQALLLGGSEADAEETQEHRPKLVKPTATVKVLSPQLIDPVRSKSQAGRKVWWVPALAVLIFLVMVVLGMREEKKTVPTAVVPVPVASVAESQPIKASAAQHVQQPLPPRPDPSTALKYLFGVTTTDERVRVAKDKVAGVWLSQSFVDNTDDSFVVFVWHYSVEDDKNNRQGYRATSSLRIGAVTYKVVGGEWTPVAEQLRIPALDGRDWAPKVEEEKTLLELSKGHFALLLDSTMSGQGVTEFYKHILEYRNHNWRSLGILTTDSSSFCGDDPVAEGCWSFTGRLSIVRSKNPQYPNIIIKRSGTKFDSNKDKVVPAGNVSYVFNGDEYIEAK